MENDKGLNSSEKPLFMSKKEELRFRLGNYGTGDYYCTCALCKRYYMGDKGSVFCLDCALEYNERILNLMMGIVQHADKIDFSKVPEIEKSIQEKVESYKRAVEMINSLSITKKEDE